ncbi:putative DNA binding protein [Tripterygium wilfordii]|uniref:AT-hook motif nuclear-localized protein n=1 Tax=Tripterygium wilfordii TaxID=458696 RepID=A0A7J7CCK3_TRIWF|nr:AT-hook motif nuclear-localized protein 1-like [Tripterygium wilfordii]KAF5731665.1 putative DNA binding protein [Tripterygium wilfordii]
MEPREGINSGVTVIGAEAPSTYHVAQRTENVSQISGPPEVSASPVCVGLAGIPGKKKRGRPRKYGPDGTPVAALSPTPISSSAPPGGEFSAGMRSKAWSGNLEKKQKRMGMENSDDWAACSSGANFTAHVIIVNSGEDVLMKIMSFSQQGPRSICILSANGLVSNVTLRQPDASGGTLTYEGRFEILSLSGSFMPTQIHGSRSKYGGVSVTLASPNGQVVGGGVAGVLVAASSVQVVIGSFLPSSYPEPKLKKQAPSPATPSTTVSASVPDPNGGKEGPQINSATRPGGSSSVPLFREPSATDINKTLAGPKP